MSNQSNIAKKNNNLHYGKVPPQQLELEKEIIGAMLNEAEVVLRVKPILSVHDFYAPSNQVIVRTIYELEGESTIPDINMVSVRLQLRGELQDSGGPYYLVQCSNSVVSTGDIEKKARIVKQMAIARKMISLSHSIITKAYEGEDPLQMVSDAEAEFSEINDDLASSIDVSKEVLAVKAADQFVGAVEKARKNLLLPPDEQIDDRTLTFIDEWDRINGELFRGGIYVIAGRPGMGKTAFLVQMIINMAKIFPVGFINGEMTDTQMIHRIISNSATMDNYVFKKPKMEVTDEELATYNVGMAEYLSLKLYTDSSSMQLDHIVSKIKFWSRKYKIRVLMLDFLQIVTVNEELAKYMSEVQVINHVCETLRAVAKVENITLILLSQLNREVYKNAGNREPNLSHLKGSGKIEEIAYQIMFLHRPEYYGIEADDTGESTKGLLYGIIAKHRDGILDRFKMRFEGQYSKVSHWENMLGNWKPIVPSANVPGGGFKSKGTIDNTDYIEFDDGFEDIDAPF